MTAATATDAPALHPYFSIDPAQEIVLVEGKAKLYARAQAVSFVAFCVLLGVTMAITHGLLAAPPAALPLLVIGIVASLVSLAVCKAKKETYQRKIEESRALSAKFEVVKKWQPQQLTDFYEKYRVVQQDNPDNMRVIARVTYFLGQRDDCGNEVRILEAEKPESFLAEQKRISMIAQRTFDQLFTHLKALEALKVLQQPTIKPEDLSDIEKRFCIARHWSVSSDHPDADILQTMFSQEVTDRLKPAAPQPDPAAPQ